MTVAEHIGSGLQTHKDPKDEIVAKVAEAYRIIRLDAELQVAMRVEIARLHGAIGDAAPGGAASLSVSGPAAARAKPGTG